MDGLATLEEDVKTKVLTVPTSRIGTAANARQIIGTFKRAESNRALRRAKQQGLLDGNPPVNPGTLKKLGRADEPNINLREAEGALDAAKTPYYDLIFEVPLFAQLGFKYGNDPMRNAEWSAISSEEFHATVDAWDGFDFNVQLHQWEMCYYGVGPLYWQDSRDWRFEALKIGKLLVPDNTKADIDRLEVCAIPKNYLAHELWKFIKNESAAAAAGWNVKAAKRAIANATVEPATTGDSHGWEYFQDQLRRGDLYWGMSQSKTIPVVHLLNREFDGKISHRMVLDDGAVNTEGSTLGNGAKDEFLYEKVGRFDSFANVICPFFFDIGTGEWHSIKGLGPKIYDFCSLSNLLTMRMIGGAMTGSGVLLQAKDGNALQATSIVRIGGGISVISPDYNVQENKIAQYLEGPLAVKRDLQNTLQSNTGQYRQRVSNENFEPTARQAEMNLAQQAVLGKGAVNRYYKILDRLYREMLRRMLASGLTKSDPGGEEALEFRQRCIERGVPEEALKFDNFCRIKATRALGYGSPQMQEVATRGLLEMLPMMDERGRRNALRTRTARLVGQSQVDQYFPPFDEGDVPNDHVWAAALENTMLRQPGATKIVVTPKQDHVIHFGEHLKDVAQHASQVQAGESDPAQLLVHLEQAGPHTWEHLQLIGQDPTRKSQFDQLQEAWQGMSKMADQLKQQLEEAAKAAEANQPAQAPDPKLIAALAAVHGNLEIKREKMMGDMQLKKEKQDQQMHLKDTSTAHGMRLRAAKQAPEGMAA